MLIFKSIPFFKILGTSQGVLRILPATIHQNLKNFNSLACKLPSLAEEISIAGKLSHNLISTLVPILFWRVPASRMLSLFAYSGSPGQAISLGA